MPLAILEFSNIYSPVWIYFNPPSIWSNQFSLIIRALNDSTIINCKFPIAVAFVLLIFPLIATTICIHLHSLAVFLIIEPLTNIVTSILRYIPPIPILWPSHVPPLVEVTQSLYRDPLALFIMGKTFF